MLFLGIACSGLGYLFWYGALERIEASRVAAFLYLEPLVTLAAAVVMLGESVTLTTVAGGLLVLAGVALVQRDGLQGPRAGRSVEDVDPRPSDTMAKPRKGGGPRRPQAAARHRVRTAPAPATTESFPVVGIGASAGGLEAFQEFFAACRPTPGWPSSSSSTSTPGTRR